MDLEFYYGFGLGLFVSITVTVLSLALLLLPKLISKRVDVRRMRLADNPLPDILVRAFEHCMRGS